MVYCKFYAKKDSIWQPALAIIYFSKIIRICYKYHMEKPIATSLLIDSALPITKPIANQMAKLLNATKRKHRLPAKLSSKQTREV